VGVGLEAQSHCREVRPNVGALAAQVPGSLVDLAARWTSVFFLNGALGSVVVSFVAV